MDATATWLNPMIAVFLGILLFHNLGYAQQPPNYTFMRDATRSPGISYYDYIIVGGGTAGCPLAATLSQNYTVLLLERGDSPYGNPRITRGENYGTWFADLNPGPASQQFISEDGVQLVRARVLGGGTSINAGFYSRGEEDFQIEAGLFDGNLVEKSYEWVEKALVSEPIPGKWQSALKSGLLEAGVRPDNGYSFDHLVGSKVGGSIFDRNGTRHTAADLLQYGNPSRLTVLLNATVGRILFKQNGKSKPMAYGVVYEDASGNTHRAYLNGGPKDEIILSAGALGSPQLLMLSGVGPKDQLDAQRINVVLEKPLVGQGMADNPLAVLFVPSPNPVEVSSVQVVGITPFGNYIEGGSGLNLVGGRPEDFLGFSPEMGGFVFSKINGPISSGDMRLLNRDPADNPSVRFNYFKEDVDLQKCVIGVQTMLAAIQTEAFSDFKYSNMTIQEILNFTVRFPSRIPVNANTTTSLEQFCKDTPRTIFHYHGGCQMGKVVDYDYKVLGVDALRVIDSSTFLRSPGTNPQATVLMIGRYMGVKILNERISSNKSK